MFVSGALAIHPMNPYFVPHIRYMHRSSKVVFALQAIYANDRKMYANDSCLLAFLACQANAT